VLTETATSGPQPKTPQAVPSEVIALIREVPDSEVPFELVDETGGPWTADQAAA
jgi:hypothetical protein